MDGLHNIKWLSVDGKILEKIYCFVFIENILYKNRNKWRNLHIRVHTRLIQVMKGDWDCTWGRRFPSPRSRHSGRRCLCERSLCMSSFADGKVILIGGLAEIARIFSCTFGQTLTFSTAKTHKSSKTHHYQ